MRRGILRCEGERALIVQDRVLNAPERVKGVAEIGVHVGRIRCDGERLPIVCGGLFMMTEGCKADP